MHRHDRIQHPSVASLARSTPASRPRPNARRRISPLSQIVRSAPTLSPSLSPAKQAPITSGQPARLSPAVSRMPSIRLKTAVFRQSPRQRQNHHDRELQRFGNLCRTLPVDEVAFNLLAFGTLAHRTEFLMAAPVSGLLTIAARSHCHPKILSWTIWPSASD